MRFLFAAICDCKIPTKKEEEMTAAALGMSECGTIGEGDEEVQKLVLHRVLLDPSVGHISKSVLTETFNSEDWQNQSLKNNQCVAMAQSTKAPKIKEVETVDEMVVKQSSTEKD